MIAGLQGSKGKGKKLVWTGLQKWMVDEGKGKEPPSCMEAETAQEEQHSQAASQALSKPFAHLLIACRPECYYGTGDSITMSACHGACSLHLHNMFAVEQSLSRADLVEQTLSYQAP